MGDGLKVLSDMPNVWDSNLGGNAFYGVTRLV